MWIWADDPGTGKRRDLTLEEHRGFWSWAVVEVLRHTGIRAEELTELSHHSLVQYSVPSSGELIPLLHIAPSKTDQERLLVVSPELADVLSAIISRIRDPSGAVPLVVSLDAHEKTWNPPMPLLLQRRLGTENRPIGTDEETRGFVAEVRLPGAVSGGFQYRTPPEHVHATHVEDAWVAGQERAATRLEGLAR